MTSTQYAYLVTLLHSYFADRPKQSVSDWCVENFRLNEPGNIGPFSLFGRQYAREILDCQSDPSVSDEVLVFGSQAGKTTILMGKASWTVRNSPNRIFWVMPTRDTVQKFSRTRLMPAIRSSPVLCELIPTGARRHDFSTFQLILGGSIIDFVWSNSPSALASVPAPIVILDEVDKFDEGGRREANAVDLANQRTKHFSVPKRIKTSTPTLTEGLIWQEFLKSDQRRRFLPCPHCQKFVVLIWSKAFTVFKATGQEAVVKWDDEAKKPDGGWDLDRVERSARFQCPHCGGHIQDAHKTIMDRNGEWRITPDELRLKNSESSSSAAGYRGWHLSSLYAASAETNVGKLAIKFLQAKSSLLGLQGFINGDLAEPYESQDTQGERIEIITDTAVDENGKVKILFADVQRERPYFWVVVMLFGEKTAHVAKAVSCDSFEEIRDLQQKEKIDDKCVVIDSGDNTKGGDSVYSNCARFCIALPRRDKLPLLMGWTPSKGMPARKRWRNSKGAMVPYRMWGVDPYDGTSKAGLCEIELFEFSGDYFKDIVSAMRTRSETHTFSVSKESATHDFWHHMDAEHKAVFFDQKTKRAQNIWVKKGRHWPNHWLDCVVGATAYADYLGKLKTS